MTVRHMDPHDGRAAAPPRVCIVTPGYIASTPRVVREADALADSGFAVRVVCTQGDLERVRRHDATLLRGKRWQARVIGWSRRRPAERRRYWTTTAGHVVARSAPSACWKVPGVAELAEGRLYWHLAREAAAEPAELYLGHYPTGLAAAAYAAAKWGVKLGYDAEDLHTAEHDEAAPPPRAAHRIALIERRYLMRCDYVTAVSEGVADGLVDRYGVDRPIVIHNAFPLTGTGAIDVAGDEPRGPGLSLYWFSQTVGLDRGLQDAIRAIGLLDGSIEIVIRGTVSSNAESELIRLARQYGVGTSLRFLPPVPPGELVARASCHDVGLALEQPVSLNRKLTVTNKLLLYLVAGLAVAATDVPGQRRLMGNAPGAGVLYRPGDYQTLANHLGVWATRPAMLAKAKAAARQAAESRWNWEREGARLAEYVARVVSGREAPAASAGGRHATAIGVG